MATHDPEHPDTCYCEDCVCRNYQDIARRHPNCRSASLDVEYRKNVPRAVDRMIAGFEAAIAAVRPADKGDA